MWELLSLDEASKVWIYQANRFFTDEEKAAIEQEIEEFVDKWASHNRQLKAYGNVFHHKFICLMVDETQAGASGCSIDSSVHFIQYLEKKYGVDLFDRLNYSYLVGKEIKTVPHEQFSEAYANGEIGDETLMFDNLVRTKKDFISRWTVPLSESWFKRMI
jgi:hypothetical protein